MLRPLGLNIELTCWFSHVFTFWRLFGANVFLKDILGHPERGSSIVGVIAVIVAAIPICGDLCFGRCHPSPVQLL